ncbi:hypothetical protein [Aliivibrio fischeri]|uniref:hypothetical protein n=1 Tax=Aliivibrio fischeri TaxID=668 RepID=UPI0012D96A99|nr:hypothetical protein [Aliivibrio fischeri]MUJ20353.1 hypothetical protein [Aliivibrio fischeri]
MFRILMLFIIPLLSFKSFAYNEVLEIGGIYVSSEKLKNSSWKIIDENQYLDVSEFTYKIPNTESLKDANSSSEELVEGLLAVTYPTGYQIKSQKLEYFTDSNEKLYLKIITEVSEQTLDYESLESKDIARMIALVENSMSQLNQVNAYVSKNNRFF